MHDSIKDLDAMNIMHAPKLQSYRELHGAKAKTLTAKLKTEAERNKAERIADK